MRNSVVNDTMGSEIWAVEFYDINDIGLLC